MKGVARGGSRERTLTMSSNFPASLDNFPGVSTGQLISSTYESNQTSAINNIEAAIGPNPSRMICEGRLTLVSNTPVADSSAVSTVYFTPFRGNRIALFDGGQTWNLVQFSQVPLPTLSGLTSGRNYDVFAYNNSGAVALELGPAWTNSTTRATDIVPQDGVWVKSGATTRRYLGTFYTLSATTTADSPSQRLLFNAQNRVVRGIAVVESSPSWPYSFTSFQQANNNGANQVAVVIGAMGSSMSTGSDDTVIAEVHHFASNTGANALAAAGIGIDNATNVANVFGGCLGAASQGNALRAAYRGNPGLGYHTIKWLEAGASSGTTTFYGAGALLQTGLVGQIVA